MHSDYGHEDSFLHVSIDLFPGPLKIKTAALNIQLRKSTDGVF